MHRLYLLKGRGEIEIKAAAEQRMDSENGIAWWTICSTGPQAGAVCEGPYHRVEVERGRGDLTR